MQRDKIIGIVDFGGQYAHLISSRIRRMGAYTEILSDTDPLDRFRKMSGIILSGGPGSVYEKNAPQIPLEIFQMGIPILGICYGHQLIVHSLGGKVEPSKNKEYGPATLNLTEESILSKNFPNQIRVWMSHGDEVVNLPPGFRVWGRSDRCAYACIQNTKANVFGIQFHPEVTHSEKGGELLSQFVSLCGAENSWSIESFIEEESRLLKKQVVEGKKVFLLVSGGVDSTVSYLFLCKILGKDKVKGIMIDTGFLRKEEANQLKFFFKKEDLDIEIHDYSEMFFQDLKGKSDPEEKRISVGRSFLKARDEILKSWNLNPQDWLLGQGTIYPDTIESGGTKHSHKIKTHHNRVDEIQKMIDEGRIVEPIRDLYKDEVRELGKFLGLSSEFVDRHPFPGPGLVVRIICNSKQIDNSIESKLQNHIQNLYNRRSRLLPVASVGVQGDKRSYSYCGVVDVILDDDQNSLETISSEITNHITDVNRVVAILEEDLSQVVFLPSQIQMNSEIVKILQEADERVSKVMRDSGDYAKIWQMPVVIIPVGNGQKLYSIVIRPVLSQEAMTADFYWSKNEVRREIWMKLKEMPEIAYVFWDITNKPPGTIEWE